MCFLHPRGRCSIPTPLASNIVVAGRWPCNSIGNLNYEDGDDSFCFMDVESEVGCRQLV